MSDYLNGLKETPYGQCENLCKMYFIAIMDDKEVF